MQAAMQHRAGSAPIAAFDQLAAIASSFNGGGDGSRPIRSMSEDVRSSPYARPSPREERKLTRRRTPKEALDILEATFAKHPYITRLSREERDNLAERTGMDDKRLCDWWRNRRSRDSKNHGPREDGPSLQQQANLVHYSQRHSGHASTYPPMMYPPPNGRFFPPGYPAYPPHPYGAGAYPPAAYGPYYQMYGGPMPSGYPAMGLGAHPSASTTSSPSESSRIKTVPSSPAAMSIDERPPATAMPVTTTQLEPAPASHFATTTLKVGSWAWRDSQEAPILTFDPAKDMLHYTHSEKGWLERLDIPMAAIDKLAFSGPSASRTGALLMLELRAPPVCVAALAKAQWHASGALPWRACADFTACQSLLSNRHELVVPDAQRLATCLLGLSATRPSFRAALTFPSSSPPPPLSAKSLHSPTLSELGRSDAPSPSLGPATPSMELPRTTGNTPRTACFPSIDRPSSLPPPPAVAAH